ncbi:SMP-30/gluconolactonase/LRE family protein [Paenibacillus sp. HB172176]|uniref:SMP-30/gluconolactonase/LRE family protein n=1 Tax=Paenibacillus sp. HB172176 TaxID=2493690 RepID=UPI00143A80B5|nr:SMP-30/gluconolactonase/LRE family protein [Paenibacillus sp. HB172176]
MTESNLKLAVDAKAQLGEGPCWDAKNGLLYWVDIMGKNIHVHNPEMDTNEIIPVGMHVGSMALRQSGGIVMAADQGFYSLAPASRRVELLHAPSEELPTNRFNDGKCDPSGRFWAGSMPFEGGAPTGHLYCMEADFKVRHMRDGIRCSNGLAWSLDQSTMYYIDTPTREVAAFRYDAGTGDIESPKVAISVPKEEGSPDGMTIDEEGMLWIAHWGGYKVSRWNPETGKKLDEIAVPAAQVTSCAFGGKNRNELYITSARIGLDEDTLQKQPHAGGVFKIELNVRGQESFVFQG